MRNIQESSLINLVAKLCVEANLNLPQSQIEKLKQAKDFETTERARDTLDQIIENAEIAIREKLPICQDCGMAVVFVKIGNECKLDFNLVDAINEGVAKGYEEGYLRKSMLVSPIDRRNTGDNTKAIIYPEIVEGDIFEVTVCPKGGGSENASKVTMLKPSDGLDGVVEFVVNSVREKGASACPPLTLGIGLGGSFEYCAFLAKKALLIHSRSDEFGNLETMIKDRCNELGIGPGGFGGNTTVLDVHILSHSCHIATLPVAVNIQCHAARHARGSL
ncbi:MAG TPA: fumarate hydratase [Caldisericia bacterium]|nr:fumarate hydratase [Caldisericia bacterium]HPF49219.1 fumarate hydratase [Caldisericia bacterium]HPI84101.1 fumarate hydratase [Caldisericia bacterium]HPQ93359.1 fumarate hydratase [Caldisericia bacterium]HRV75259.1 fumarate hydratase [Caldisericia bacterium]